MIAKKFLNNNSLVAVDNEGNEYVLLGKGISFSGKIGEQVDDSKIEKIFDAKEKSKLEALVENIPQQYFDLAVEIIDYVEAQLNTKLNNIIYITLTDHVAYLKERYNQGLIIANSLKQPIKRYYKKEFKVSRKIVELLEDEFDIELNDDEVASIALHIINAEQDDSTIHDSMTMIKYVEQIMQIIRYQTNMDIDQDDLDYQRLQNHIEFFLQRVIHGEKQSESPLFDMVVKSYPEAYRIALKVSKYVEEKLHVDIHDDELTYMIIHIQRIIEHKT
ncbi:PRD domain-containing protein [Sharpea azabuensis]|uniref:PRD domain-containing protein n=1 Tax=Sharpea azabuensis TaxID=322505 RepID=UPI00051C99B5|nr:PRD domain-containing protein [Sharpea azabuensis]